MDRASRVIYIGTFSKVLFPSLRVGYLVAPPQLIDSFLEHRDALDLFPATLYQMALTDFLTEGHFARHLRRMRAVYVGRRDALVAGIRRLAAETLTIVNSDAGMHLTAWLPPKVDDQEIVRRAAARGIDAVALSTCYVGTAKRMGLVLGFGGVNEVEIENALQGLVAVIRRCRNSPTS
jgi:GntR family transcriptional regulator/MocR family aminotransferase